MGERAAATPAATGIQHLLARAITWERRELAELAELAQHQYVSERARPLKNHVVTRGGGKYGEQVHHEHEDA